MEQRCVTPGVMTYADSPMKNLLITLLHSPL
jgi:hypothetical protein